MQFQRSLLAVSFLAVSLCAAGAAAGPAVPGAGAERMLNNEGLVVLARAGYNERFLAEMIQSQPNRFDTSVEGLVYLAKQGISERIVRMVISEQKAAERRDAERAAADYAGEPLGHAAPPPAAKPVRMKVTKQKVLVPVSGQPHAALGADAVIVVEKRVFGDRYYAMPGAQAPMSTPVATQVAAFH